jgi:hypothetical protein
MNLKRQFLYDPAIEVSAAQIGISRWNWVSINTPNQEEALNIMKSNRFDVLPIENTKGSIESYFSTQDWNVYDNINKNKIKGSQAIYYRLSLKDLVKKFKDNETHYYFLTDYDQILGLVSFVNLNCQLVYNYLFFILTDIERGVSQLLKKHLNQEDLIAEFEKSSDRHIQELLETYYVTIENNFDNDIFQHMYLQTIGVTLSKSFNQLPTQYKGLNKFSKKFGTEGLYTKIRNKVMHPVQPIISLKEDINQLHQLLTDYAKIKVILDGE